MSLITFVAWSLLILVLTFIIFASISFYLGQIYPETQESKTSPISEEMQELELSQRRRKWIGLFVLVALALIMTMTGINAFMNTRI